MKILDKFRFMAEGKEAHIGIGLGGAKIHNLKILKASIEFLRETNSIVHIFGDETSISYITKNLDYQENSSNIELLESDNPEKQIINHLIDKIINGAVRGSLASTKFLKYIKEEKISSEILRLTLLETIDGYQFFYGPVGIDECNNFQKKKIFIEKALVTFKSLEIIPKISILSGGRKGDIGRDNSVDKTLKEAEDIVNHFKKDSPDLGISDDEILIEKAIQNNSNLIIAPEGISGNLIYRTLVHLGGGKAHGAIYMNSDQIIIDTSRVGSFDEIKSALLLALSLT